MLVVALAYSLYLTCAVAFPFYENTNNVWALLAAGSYGYENYRHQANVAHAYNLLISKGVAAERIITFLYDDIAYNPLNPYPGSIFNEFSDKNYYENLSIDYSGENVTKLNFLAVLKGDAMLKEKGYKVLESGENDNVFIYYSGLGVEEIIFFPDDLLLAEELNSSISILFHEKKYSKLVFYLESSFSGSMFENILSPNINAYALTAASSKEESFPMFCNDPEISVCLANEFSYNWIADSEEFDLNKHTLKEQFVSVKDDTKSSTVQQFGDLIFKEGITVSVSESQKNLKLILLHQKKNRVPGVARNIKKFFAKRQFSQAFRNLQLVKQFRKLAELCKRGYSSATIASAIENSCL